MVNDFDLATEWKLDAPIDEVWATLRAVEQWPRWWPSVRQAEPIAAGNEMGIGATHRLVWKTALPYCLTLTTKVIAVEPTHRIEVRAWGDVEGTGIWFLRRDARGATIVRYVWRVSVNTPWMRRILPILKPVFAWNHVKVMGVGGVGLRRHLAERALSR